MFNELHYLLHSALKKDNVTAKINILTSSGEINHYFNQARYIKANEEAIIAYHPRKVKIQRGLK